MLLRETAIKVDVMKEAVDGDALKSCMRRDEVFVWQTFRVFYCRSITNKFINQETVDDFRGDKLRSRSERRTCCGRRKETTIIETWSRGWLTQCEGERVKSRKRKQ